MMGNKLGGGTGMDKDLWAERGSKNWRRPVWMKRRLQAGQGCKQGKVASKVDGVGGEEAIRVPMFGRWVWPPCGKGQGHTGRGKTQGADRSCWGLRQACGNGKRKGLGRQRGNRAKS